MRFFWLLAVLVPVFIPSNSLAGKRGGWSSRTTTQGNSTQYYYRPAVQANQQYGVQTQSGCVHGPNGSSCQHRYEVQRDYANRLNGENASQGTIRYAGGEGNQYYHQGQPYQIQGIDQVESVKANANRETARALNEISKLKADIQTSLVQIRGQLQNGQISRTQHDLLLNLQLKYEEAIDSLAKATQERRPEWQVYYVKLCLQQLSSVSALQEDYDRVYNPANLRRTQELRLVLALCLLLMQ